MICASCGYENSEDSQFCSQCGFPLAIAEGNLVTDSIADDVERMGLSSVVPHVIDGLKTGQFPSSLAEKDGGGAADTFPPADAEGERGESADGEADGDAASAAASISGLPVEEEAGFDGGDSAIADDGEAVVDPADPDGEAPEPDVVADDAAPHEDDSADTADDDDEADDRQDILITGKHARMPAPEDDPDRAESVRSLPEPLGESDDPAGRSDDSEAGEGQSDAVSWQDGHDAAPAVETEAISPAASSDGTTLADSDRASTLQDLPQLGKRDYEYQERQDTAVMPPVARAGAVRYSVGDRDEKDFHRKGMPKVRMALAAVLAVLAILAGINLVANGISRGVEVPDVVGMSSEAARSQLQNAGFQVEVKSQMSEDNFGIVLSCDPAAGTKKRSGSTVVITVSASRTIPDVAGMDVESAKEKLAEEGAKAVIVATKASNQPENTVLDVEPKVGAAFKPDDEITLTVATAAIVPDVTNMTEDEAKAAVNEAGYVAEVKWADSDYDAGTVLSTSPDAGASASLNSTVTIYVASPGPRDIYHLMDFFDATSANNSEYLQWKGYAVSGSYTYDKDGTTYASQVWKADDGSTVSFTPAPYLTDLGLSTEDYLAQGFGYEGIRLCIPTTSALSLTTDISMSTVQAYMDACGFDTIKDTCSVDDVKADNGATGKELGLPNFICAQGETNGRIWTVLVTEDATFLGCGSKECYKDMDPICDAVAVNEMYTS